MNKFEAVLLISPEISQKVLLKEIEDFKKQIDSNKGKVVNSEDWGLRDLSYNIASFKKAFYKFFQIEISGGIIPLIKNNLSNNENILRHLFIRVEKHQELPTKLYYEKK
tara:strand:- start:110 stop:436 length:327 start_codon:yes stop_codon:yes gene_type:complete